MLESPPHDTQHSVPPAPPPSEFQAGAGLGFIENAFYLRSVGGKGGFLTLIGWYSPIRARPETQVIGRTRIAGREYTFPCVLRRTDVVEFDPRLRVECGFDVTLALPDGFEERGVPLGFYGDGMPLGTLFPVVSRPEEQVAERADTLSPLTVKKLYNLILNERERLSHAVTLKSMPVVGHIDPSFACQLHCPLCAGEMIRQDGYTMRVMTVPQIDTILQNYGDYLIRIWLSLWGEPLLNKRLPELIERCKQREIFVLISTNLSVPMDAAAAEALVRSGVDSLTLSIDGATQPVYEIYRKGGDLGLVLNNIRLLVEAKRRLGMSSPFLYWRYLEFDWNRQEIEPARALAAELGVDLFGVERGITTPPIRASMHEHQADAQAHAPIRKTVATWQRLAQQKQEAHGWFGCDYLYSSVSINSNGSVHPCCYVVAPYDTLGNAADRVNAVRNAPMMQDNRRMFGTIATGGKARLAGREPCVSCGVVASTKGQVLAQANFRTLFDHLMGRKPMPW